MGAFLALATSSAPSFNWASVVTSSTFQPLIDGITSLVPIIIATVIPLIVIRKGWDFLKGNIYSA